MSAVDVLRTLDDCGAYVDDAASFPEHFKAGVVKRHQREYAEARAAVAELVEAANAVASLYADEPEDELDPAWVDFRAALRRMEGQP